MGIYDETLWKYLECKVEEADRDLPGYKKCGSAYLTGMRAICDFAVDLSLTIRDVFPMFTLHDERHICSVMQKMVQLLGDQLETLSRDEAAMLILAACCHDLGMSCSKTQRLDLQQDGVRLKKFYDDHPDAYVRMLQQEDQTKLPDDLLRDFLRSIHHERVSEILRAQKWPDGLSGKVRQTDLVEVCRSHGVDVSDIIGLRSPAGVDLRMCAILLRLADILDFDSSRAPRAVYEYCGFNNQQEDAEAAFSKAEWDKHVNSLGFCFDLVDDHAYPYELPYRATCKNMQTEQAITTYLDWVDRELTACQGMLRYCDPKWQKLILPRKILREIEPDGYDSGQFCFTLDQDRILELLVGENLYQDPGVFVRELLQNAIDAVRTRQQMDKYLPHDWKPQIKIRCWMDAEGYHWFRIEDNGTGMNQEIIEKYFLKVGRSYYTSGDFQRDKHRNQADADYQPISRFGIGILSCFMGDKATNRVEVSTLHFSENSDGLRMSMQGLTGYYYIASQSKWPDAEEMKGVLPEERRPYRSQPGTAIAVRTSLYQTGKYRSFREILDQYVAFPPVAVHYEDENESYDYPTERELMEAMHAIAPSDDPEKRGVLEFVPTPEQIREMEEKIPGLKIIEPPRVVLKCDCLDQYGRPDLLSGAVLLTKAEQGKSSCTMQFAAESVKAEKIEYSAAWEGHRIRLHVSVSLPKSFGRKMNVLHVKWDALRRESPWNEELLDGIFEGYDSVSDWHDYFREKTGLSENELRQEIASVRAWLSSEGINMALLRDFRNKSLDTDITICDLEQHEWYRRFWRDMRDRKDHVSIASHNGVRCGDAESLLSPHGYGIFGPIGEAVLLLKDGYRPELDVARENIQRLPLAAALEFELLTQAWDRQGFNAFWRGVTVDWQTAWEAYDRVLEERPDLVQQLWFETDRGTFRAAELDEKLCRFGSLKWLTALDYRNSQVDVVVSCCGAYLRKHYTLMGKFDCNGSVIRIMPKNGQDTILEQKAFPPVFFLPVEGNSQILSIRNRDGVVCNEAHPLSRFLIRNHAELKRVVPGLFREIMNSLATCRGPAVITTVNDCLRRIQSLPGDKLKVPADAFLSETDFA